MLKRAAKFAKRASFEIRYVELNKVTPKWRNSYSDRGLKTFMNNVTELARTMAQTWRTYRGKLVIIASE